MGQGLPHLLQKVAQVARLPFLKKTVMADLRLSAMCTGCKLQCVKKAASSMPCATSSSCAEPSREGEVWKQGRVGVAAKHDRCGRQPTPPLYRSESQAYPER